MHAVFKALTYNIWSLGPYTVDERVTGHISGKAIARIVQAVVPIWAYIVTVSLCTFVTSLLLRNVLADEES